MLKLDKNIKSLKPSNLHYKIRIITYKSELRALIKSVKKEFLKLPRIIQNILIAHQFTSVEHIYGKFYTIKQPIDTRIYGPLTTHQSDILSKWITGEYNSECEYDFDSDDDNPEFNYNMGRVRGESVQRIRKIPHFVDVILFNFWSECDETCPDDCPIRCL